MKLILLIITGWVIQTNCLFNYGDIFAGIGHGTIKRFNQNGTLIQTITSPINNSFITGMTFDKNGNLYAAKLDINVVSKFDSNGVLQVQNYLEGDLASNCESVIINLKGEFYVGHQLGTKKIIHYSADGTKLATFSPIIESSGTNHLDLALDNCTMFYTSYGSKIKRFNVCTNQQLNDFATVPISAPPVLFGFKIRNNGEVLVASMDRVFRFGVSGNLLQTYLVPSCVNPSCVLYTLVLDPDNTTFWIGDLQGGKVFHYNINTGNFINSFNTNPLSVLGGLAIYTGPSVVIKSIILTPNTANRIIGSQITLNIQLINFENPANVSIEITGANGPMTFIINGDETGLTQYIYTGSNPGNDLIVAKATFNSTIIDSNVATITWNNQNCQYKLKRCVNSTSYQVCRIGQDSLNFWDDVEFCCSGYTCNQTENYIGCTSNDNLPSNSTDPPSNSTNPPSDLICTYGQMRCDTQSSYQMCNKGSNNQTFWDQRQFCQTNLVCQQVNNSIYCLDTEIVNQPETCIERHMRCASSSTYQTCVSRYNILSWAPAQSCGIGTTCHQADNVIYCY